MCVMLLTNGGRVYLLLEYYMPVPTGMGKKRIEIRIESSARDCPEALFRYYEIDHTWTVCWMVELQDKLIISILREVYPSTEWDFERMKRGQEGLNALRVNNTSYSFCTVEDDIGALLEKLCEKGLPKPKRKTGGQDGHSFYIRIEGFSGDYLDTGEYYSWCYLPEEWAILEGIINRSIEYANLDFKGYGAMVNWHRKN